MRHSFLNAALTATALLASSASASPLTTTGPVVRDTSKGGLTDTTILNYALILEHLEAAFYSGALARFSAADFARAGLPAWVRSRFVEIADHEKTHVAFLTGALGKGVATQACTYNFPYTDPKSFTALSQVLEGVGVSAYSGAAQFLENPAFVTAAASILSTEARHAAWVSSAAEKFAPWSGAFDTPLGLNQVFTLAAAFIRSCPSTNPALPVTAFPALSFTGAVVPGKSASFTLPGAKPSQSGATTGITHIVFFTGLDKVFVEVHHDNDNKNGWTVEVPKGLAGQVYVVATSSATEVTDETTVAGPAVLRFERDSEGRLIA